MKTTYILTLFLATATLASAMEHQTYVEFREVDNSIEYAVEYHTSSISVGYLTSLFEYYARSKPGNELLTSFTQEELEEQFNTLKNIHEKQAQYIQELLKTKQQ